MGEAALQVEAPRSWSAENTDRRLHFWNEDVGPNLAVARFSTAKWYAEGNWRESGLSFGASRKLLNPTEAETEDIDCYYERIYNSAGECEYETDLFDEDEETSEDKLDQGIETAFDSPTEDEDEEASAGEIIDCMTSADGRCDSVANERVWPSEDHDITYSSWTNCTDAGTDFVAFIARPRAREDEQEDYIAFGSITIAREGDWEVVDRLFESLEVEPQRIS